MANRIMRYTGEGRAFIEGIPARNILLKDWEALPKDVRTRAEESGLYVSALGDAEPLEVEIELPARIEIVTTDGIDANELSDAGAVLASAAHKKTRGKSKED